MASLAGFGAGVSGAVDSLFKGYAHEAKADMFNLEAQMDLVKGKGAQIEGERYGIAQNFARLNQRLVAESTALQQVASERKVALSLGSTRAAVGASGLQESGSALDVIAASEQQGALERQILTREGLITEEGYKEQVDVYGKMIEASGVAVEAAGMAHKMHLKAAEMEDDAATMSYIGAGIKSAFAIGSLFV